MEPCRFSFVRPAKGANTTGFLRVHFMFDADKFFLVAHRRVVLKGRISEEEIRKRLCSGDTETIGHTKWNGQPVSKEDDGRNVWHVTYTRKPSPDGKMLMAFVVDVDPYGADSRYDTVNSNFEMNAGR